MSACRAYGLTFELGAFGVKGIGTYNLGCRVEGYRLLLLAGTQGLGVDRGFTGSAKL